MIRVRSKRTQTIPNIPNWKYQISSEWDTVRPEQIWVEYEAIPPAVTVAQAQANAAAMPNIIHNYSAVGQAIHLTPAYESRILYATEVYGDLSTKAENWISPTFVPREDGQYYGLPSLGYMMTLYNGDPDTGGTPIPDMLPETGNLERWSVHYGNGVVYLGEAYNDVKDLDDLWLTGFRYIGQLQSDTSLVVSGVVSTTVPFYCESTSLPGDLVCISATTNNMVTTVTDNRTDRPVIGIITEKVSPTSCRVLTYGLYPNSFAWVTSRGEKVFVDTTGQPSSFPPSTGYKQTIGYSPGDNRLFVNPSYDRIKSNPF